jgi:hypothetical protein
MHNPCGRPDLRVGVGVDIVHEEIDQPALLPAASPES